MQILALTLPHGRIYMHTYGTYKSLYVDIYIYICAEDLTIHKKLWLLAFFKEFI